MRKLAGDITEMKSARRRRRWRYYCCIGSALVVVRGGGHDDDGDALAGGVAAVVVGDGLSDDDGWDDGKTGAFEGVVLTVDVPDIDGANSCGDAGGYSVAMFVVAGGDNGSVVQVVLFLASDIAVGDGVMERADRVRWGGSKRRCRIRTLLRLRGLSSSWR